MKNINEQVLSTMILLKNDSKSLIKDMSYDSFHAYVEGYVDGLNMTLDYNLRGEITKFFEAKGNHHTNCYWTNQIKHRNKEKTDNELTEILVETTEEYFLENTNWYKEMNKSKIKKKLYFWFNGLKNRQGMFIEERLPLSIYLEALVDGLNVYCEKNLRHEISHWFYQKTKQEALFHWTNQIQDYYTGLSQDINRKLVEVTEEYFKTSEIF